MVQAETSAAREHDLPADDCHAEVFGRDVSFDPQTDPIVRIEAGHLRRALERYYLTSGQADPIVITIPKGGYVPVFSVRSQLPWAEAPTPGSRTTTSPAGC